MSAPALIALLLFGILAGIEWRRVERSRRAQRIGANGVAVLALLALARLGTLPPAIAAPSTEPAGPFPALDAPDEIGLGEPFTVRGATALAPADTGWVILQDPTGQADSVPVSAARPEFELRTRPRAASGVAYQLSLRTAAGVWVESLGVAVRALPPPALLILDASPSFETTYLKRWLADRGARLTLRIQLTRGRARVEQVNDVDGPLAGLTSTALTRYDAVLAEAAALAALGAGERAALTQAVEREGLGLLLTAGDPAAARLPLLTPFALAPAAEPDRHTARPAWAAMPRRSRLGIEVEPAVLRRRAGQQQLILDQRGRGLAARQSRGAGSVAVTLVRAPSRWQLEGETELFASYWSVLLQAVARDTGTEVRIEGRGAPAVDRRMGITLLSGADLVRASIVGPDGTVDPVALARDAFDHRRWSGAWWPRSAGWHAVRLAGRDVPFLVVAQSDRGIAVAGTTGSPRSVGVLVAFGVLLGALTWLWAESRRRAG